MKLLNLPNLPPTPLPKKPLHRFKTLLPSSSLLFPHSSNALTFNNPLSLSPPSSDFDFTKTIDKIFNFGVENPLIIAGGIAIALIPVIVLRTFGGKKKGWGVAAAKSTYARLAESESAQLVDVRGVRELREAGSPDLRGLKKKVVGVSFVREDKVGFLKKVSLRFRDPGSTTLFVIDKYGLV